MQRNFKWLKPTIRHTKAVAVGFLFIVLAAVFVDMLIPRLGSAPSRRITALAESGDILHAMYDQQDKAIRLTLAADKSILKCTRVNFSSTSNRIFAEDRFRKLLSTKQTPVPLPANDMSRPSEQLLLRQFQDNQSKPWQKIRRRCEEDQWPSLGYTMNIAFGENVVASIGEDDGKLTLSDILDGRELWQILLLPMSEQPVDLFVNDDKIILVTTERLLIIDLETGNLLRERRLDNSLIKTPISAVMIGDAIYVLCDPGGITGEMVVRLGKTDGESDVCIFQSKEGLHFINAVDESLVIYKWRSSCFYHVAVGDGDPAAVSRIQTQDRINWLYRRSGTSELWVINNRRVGVFNVRTKLGRWIYNFAEDKELPPEDRYQIAEDKATPGVQ